MNWEISILQFIDSLRGEILNNIFQLITFTGEGILLIGIMCILYWCINKELGLKFGFIMLLSTLGNGFIKNIVKAQRPFELGVIEGIRKHTATGYSFPSGHTQSATTFWLTVMLYVKEKWVYYVGALMIGLVALSRIYLGVHWPVDILGAIFIGVAFTIMGYFVFERFQMLGIATLLFICLLIGSTLILNFDRDYTKALGSIIGFLIGVVLERRYISFSTEGLLGVQALKVIMGFGGLIVLVGGLKFALPQLMIFDFLRYMIMVIWIIAGAPYLFKKIIVE